MGGFGDATLMLEDDGGRANSVEDVGREGLADESAMLLVRNVL